MRLLWTVTILLAGWGRVDPPAATMPSMNAVSPVTNSRKDETHGYLVVFRPMQTLRPPGAFLYINRLTK